MAPSDLRDGVAIVGYGAIGTVLAGCLLAAPQGPPLRAVLARSTRDRARADLPSAVRLAASPGDLLGPDTGLVVECCGHSGLRAIAPAVLAAGRDLMIVSTGVLAEPGLLEAWLHEARRGGGRILIPAGAIAGLDGLGACRLAGLERVVYTSTKPPAAWRGTPAEAAVDLAALDRPQVFFDGSAREAALAYPMNANLAATVALAGMGLDRTVVRLVADPGATGNTGHLLAVSAVGRVEVTVSGQASANPKTSAITPYSLARAIADRTARIVV
jgi:aspartate dehydrogenase